MPQPQRGVKVTQVQFFASGSHADLAYNLPRSPSADYPFIQQEKTLRPRVCSINHIHRLVTQTREATRKMQCLDSADSNVDICKEKNAGIADTSPSSPASLDAVTASEGVDDASERHIPGGKTRRSKK